MGRLTLNVLLSFAQFEREVTGERIRDKIAASKKKGLWMGGVVPLGYRVEDRKLLVDKDEAKIVRRIFERYRTLGSLPALQRELTAEGIVTRERRLASGKVIGAIAFANGALSQILRNRLYLGELNHRGQSWPAEHEPIIDKGLFDAVQTTLAENLNRAASRKAKTGALLMCKIFDDRGNSMSPSFAVKKGVRYRYYVSSPIAQGRKAEAGSIARVPADAVEARVIKELRRGHGAVDLTNAVIIAEMLDRVVVRPQQLEIRRLEPTAADLADRMIMVEWVKPSATRRREIIPPEAADKPLRPIRVEEQARLVKAIGLARRWLDEIVEGAIDSIEALAAREQRSERSVRMTLSLAFLDPAIVKAAVDGQLPRGYGVSRLVDLPMAFSDQWSALGLNRPG